ncbi:MAG: hypothetical protein EOO88_21535 [Pedobacter sp.]|nr:MAG: hypothetical protein EOO88_21535 [Pedobacter sp.]
MNFNKLLILSLILCMGLIANAQEVIRTNIKIKNYKPGIQEIELTFSSFILDISSEGEVFFQSAEGSGNYRDLEVTYYDNFNSSKSGKIKSIDGVPIDYYTEYDIHDKKGRVKSIGKMAVKYNNNFDIHDVSGTLKSIGDIDIKYNNAFDIHETKGTLKSIGPIKIEWYNSFDAKNLRGRIKSIKGNTPALHVTRLSSRRDW